jgi:4-aminobutyrate aminotransferase-like enzyme/Ser/Thr protein kinase RdoA (MazF antagonist)
MGESMEGMAELEADPLRERPPAFGAQEAARIAARSFGLEGTVSRLASERDENYRLDVAAGSFVLKISNSADGAAFVEMQTAALLHVERVDPSLPVMRVVRTAGGEPWTRVAGGDGREHFVRMFTFLPGRNPVTEDLDRRALEGWGSVVARLGQALRGFFHPAARQLLLWDIGQAPGLRPLVGHLPDDGRRAAVVGVLDRYDRVVAPVFPGLRAQVIHNDMSLDNVLVDGSGAVTGITDFGDMNHTALVCDLAVALADVLDGRPDAIDMAVPLIAGYTSVTPLEDAEAALLGDLVAARVAAAMTLSAWRVDLYPENAEYVATFGEGAWKFLQLIQGMGFDEFGRQLRGAVEAAALPYRPSTPTERLLERRHRVMGGALQPLSYRTPLHLVRGEGVWMFDPEGRRYLDVYNNVPVVGHEHPRVVRAIAEQARRLNSNTRYLHEAAVELAERLTSSMPDELDTVLFVNSGSEANDLAWRLATQATGRSGAIVTSFAYHGVTQATADLSPEAWFGGRRPDHVELVEPPDRYRGRGADMAGSVGHAADALAARDRPLAAMFLDTGFTSDGVFWPADDAVLEAARAVREAGGLLVADEVQVGHGRSGERLWSFATAGVVPDMVTLGKPMGNGHPVAAVVFRREVADRFAHGRHIFSTFGGNPVACAAALAVLDVIEDEGIIENARTTGAHLLEQLTALQQRHELIGEVRGRGLLIGVDLVEDRSTREPAREAARQVVDAMRDRGVLIGTTGPHQNVLKLRPPLVFDTDHSDQLFENLDDVLEARTR